MLSGIFFALSAGLMWGLVFVAPLLVPDYPAMQLSTGRYLAFGLIVLPLAWIDRKRLLQLTRRDWLEAFKLAAVGNLLYYLFLTAAIQRIGVPITSMLIGTLPVVIAICSNLRDAERDGRDHPARLPDLPGRQVGRRARSRQRPRAEGHDVRHEQGPRHSDREDQRRLRVAARA